LARIELIFTESWERTQPGQLIQNSQKGYSIPRDIMLTIYLKELAGKGYLLLSSGLGTRQWEHCTVYSLFCIFFLSVLLLLLLSSFAVLLNCLYPNTQALLFTSDSPPHPTGVGEASKWPHGSLLPAGAKRHCIKKYQMWEKCYLFSTQETEAVWTEYKLQKPHVCPHVVNVFQIITDIIA